MFTFFGFNGILKNFLVLIARLTFLQPGKVVKSETRLETVRKRRRIVVWGEDNRDFRHWSRHCASHLGGSQKSNCRHLRAQAIAEN